MPLFEYYCEECQKDFTLLQPTSVNKKETTCPDCKGKKVQYKLSTFASKIRPSQSNKGPVTADDLPNKNVLNLPLPRLRSEL